MEGKDTQKRIDKIVLLGKNIFNNSVNKVTIIKFLKNVSPFIHPDVFPAYWEHIFAASYMGYQISSRLKIPAQEIENSLLLHDIGRLAIPNRYYRTDLIGRLMLEEIGINKELVDLIPNMKLFLEGNVSFDKLTPEQRIVNLSDNLGKRTPQGDLFALDDFEQYLKKEIDRYPKHSFWLSEEYGIEHEQKAALMQRKIVRETLQWLSNLGIDFNQIRESVKNYAPKIIYLIRHGDLDNPDKVVYNHDGAKNITLELSEKGNKQIRKLAKIINLRGVRFSKIYTSDLLRTRQSAAIFASEIGVGDIIKNEFFREVYAPGFVGMPLKEFKEKYKGNIYKDEFVKRFGHETMEQVSKRVIKGLKKILLASQNGSIHIAIVSHGDPIRFLREKLEFPQTNLTSSDYEKLTSSNYLEKGQAWEIILDPNGNFLKAQIIDPEQE